jgi:TIR domain
MSQRPLYEMILFDDLRITPEFLKEREETINEGLSHAGTELARENGDIFAINQCLHLATSLVLQKAATLNWALDRVRQNPAFSGKDPTTVVTIATLFKILQTEPGPGASSWKSIRQRFEEINWMVGGSSMGALGICGEVVYDVFLCHNSLDKEAVKAVGEQLKALRLKPWLDEWELRPGLPWQRALERQIESIGSAAVFVGKNGIGPWQDVEQEAFLRQFVRRSCPVIPVILRDCKETPQLPPFLEGMTWVDFRKQEPNPLDQLIWGITGYKEWRHPSR